MSIKLRILTWNVNGLRAVLKRKNLDLRGLLELLDADIICFQETKLTKSDFDRSLALVDGWESFFSINRGKSAYSGTATFCRRAVAPKAAQEGVTGLLKLEKGDDFLCRTSVGYEGALLSSHWSRHTQDELEIIDAEGRCVVTDHGAFVLFNLYGPAVTNEESAKERFAYKLQFYRALQCRVDALRSLGRRVIVVGDLNICPQPIDSCDPGPLVEFADRADRRWLNSLLKSNGGPFADTFRQKHPHRTEAYTCWSTASSARVNNWGSRIDHILAADGVPDSQDGIHFAELLHSADIWVDMPGSDHAPVWACLQLPYAPHPPEVAPALSTRNIFTAKGGPQDSSFHGDSGEELTGRRSLKRRVIAGATKGWKARRTQSTLTGFVQPLAASPSGRVQQAQTVSQRTDGADLRTAAAVKGMETAEQAWLQPVELTGPSQPTGMQPLACSSVQVAAAASPDAGSLKPALEDAQRESAAKAAWQQIQERMKPPKCKGHAEPMVIRQVKKKGPNNGETPETTLEHSIKAP